MDKKHLISLLIILAVGLIAYANSFGGDFVWDAAIIVESISHLRGPVLQNIKYNFTHAFFDTSGDFNYYRPVTMLLFMLDYGIWGQNPVGYHLINFLLHFINACLIYLILFHYSRRRLPALFLSLIFITHPSATEAIAYIASMSDPLALAFLLSSALFFHFWLKGPGKRTDYIVSILIFILACFSKESSVMLPAFLLVHALAINSAGKGRIKKTFFAIVPFFAVSIGYLSLRYFILAAGKNTFFSETDIGLLPRLIAAPAVIIRYAAAFMVPRTFIMAPPVMPETNMANPFVFIPVILVLAVLALTIKFYKSRAGLGAAWFFLFIFPVSGILPINSFFYNHWLYIPSAGLLLVISELICRYKNINRAALSAGALLIALCCFLTIRQNVYFRDDMTLYNKTIEKYPKYAMAHYNLGTVFGVMGSYEKAASCYQEAIRLDPEYTKAYYNLGILYKNRGLYNEAIELYKKAASINPNSFDIHNNLALTYILANQTDKAIPEFKEAMRINPRYAEGYSNLGALYLDKRSYGEARAMFKKALEIKPSLTFPRESLKKLGEIDADK